MGGGYTVKMGLHGMLPMTPGSQAREAWERYHQLVRPPTSKLCRQGFDPALMDWTRRLGTKLIGRWVDYQLTFSAAANGRIADQVLAELLPWASHLDYIEFANEELQGKKDPGEWTTLMTACLDFMRKLDAANRAAGRAGPKACIANVSVGQPELERWNMPEALATARYAADNGHAWGAHEYYKPRPWDMVDGGREAWNGPAPAEGWLMLRVAKVVRQMRAHGIVGFRFIVTESGRDNIPGQPGEGAGWKDEPTTPDGDYADFMAQYGRHLSALPECIGWNDFGFNAWAGWERFDLADSPAMLERLARLQGAIPETQKPVTPAPPKEAPVLEQYLNAEFGQGGWDDLRASLPANPGGPAGDFSTRQLSLIDTIAVHHSAGSIDQSWQTIAAYHIGPERGWAGIGYHLGVRNGRVAYLGGIEKGRACVGQLNHRVICVCVTGDYTRAALAAQDRRALERTIKALQRWSAAKLQRQLRVKGHGELPGQSTACPGGAITAILPALAAITPDGGGVVDAGPSTALLARAEQHRVMRLNRAAALQKAILRDGFVPVSGEFTEAPYTAQLAESLATGAVRVYYASAANWNNVRYLQR